MECADDGMDCREVLDQVYEYLDGELDADAVAAFFAARETIREVLAQWRDDLRNILAAPWDADTIGGGAQPRREPEAAAEAAQPAALELPANPV